MRIPFPGFLLLAAALLLAGCDSAEERAEGYYRHGMELLARGETERALLEFRNAVRLNGAHVPAHLAFARIQRARGEIGEALDHYLHVVDQDRANVAGHRELAEVALLLQDFEAAEAHAARAFALAPDDPAVRALKATVDYRGGDRAAAIAMARGVLAATPDSVPAHMVLIADRLDADDPQAALALVDAALAAVPGDQGLHLTRLATLERLGDAAGIGAELRRMTELFPADTGVREALVQWHLRQGDTAAAEAVLRETAARDPADPQGALSVVQFLYATAGPAAARAELDRLVAASADPAPFQRARADLDFAEGDTAAAIAALRALTAGAPASDETRDLQVALAEMLDATGDADGRDALLAGVLEADDAHVAALKLRARALIAADQPEAAIRDMRAALAQAPRDPEIMTIMAMAYEREGSRELMGERLALAVETSDRAPEESLRYARFLMQEGRVDPAEGVILDALRRAPGQRELLLQLGQIHLDRRDWKQAGQVARRLRELDDPAATEMAAGLELAALRGQDRLAETVAMLEDLAGAGGDAVTAELVRTYVAAGDLDAAQRQLEEILARDPASLPGRMMQAGLYMLRGDQAAAEALYRALTAEAPALPQPHQALVLLLAGQGRDPEAAAALAAGIATTGRDGRLLFLQAGQREAAGDIDGAIALYEELYARDSADLVVANNLASLIATHRADSASLDRAFAIARRLRGSDLPHFRDTYGWILHRRGDSAQALDFLAPAAEGLPDDPLVQFHLAEAQYALGRWDAARAGFLRAVDLAGPESPLPQIATARERIAAIDARPPADPGSEG